MSCVNLLITWRCLLVPGLATGDFYFPKNDEKALQFMEKVV